MKNRDQLKQAFDRFPKVDILYTDGQRIFASPTEGAKKVNRSEVMDLPNDLETQDVAPESKETTGIASDVETQDVASDVETQDVASDVETQDVASLPKPKTPKTKK